MAHYSDAGSGLREQRPDPQAHQLSHRISNLSEISAIDTNPYDAPSDLGGEPTSPRWPRRARESLISLDSRQSYASLRPGDDADDVVPALKAPTRQGLSDAAGDSREEHAHSAWRPYSSSSSGHYAPISPSGSSRNFPGRALSRVGRLSSKLSKRYSVPDPIDEEEYDMSLMQSAAPMGRKYDVIPAHHDDEPIAPVGVDLTTSLGPVSVHDEAFMQQLQAQEARGRLTGGIGRGFQPGSTIRDAELLSSPTVVNRSLSRTFSRRAPTGRLGRAQTIRDAGQDEANRRGEIIEVIVEDQSDDNASVADISTLGGPTNISLDEARRARTGLSRSDTKQVFYPQPDWKPFSMRWPYLVMLVLVSVALATLQEMLTRRYTRDNPVLRFTSPEDVDAGIYFSIKFGPTIAAVVFGVLWQFADFEVRRLEAFYQMSKPEGALAAESINVDYVTSFNFFRPFRALMVGHYAVALSAFATTLAVSLVPTFAAASIILVPDRHERAQHPDDAKSFLFSPVWSHLLASTLAICAACGCGLIYLLQTRKSGLIGDVRGIAGLASMAVVSHILMDFKDLDTAKPRDIHNKLKEYRYLLQNSSLTPDDQNPVPSAERERYEVSNLSENPHPLMLRPAGTVPFIVALLLFMGFIPTFLFTPADVVTDRASFVITAMSVCLKLSWGSLETAVRMMEPYYILSRRHAPSKTLTLDYTALPFGYMPLRALFNGHFLVFFVGFGTVMSEFLTILVTGLATVDGRQFMRNHTAENHARDESTDEDDDRSFSGQETLLSFYVSFGLSMFILLYMITVASTVFLRRRHPFLPRQPNTIASVLAFIHQSKMVYSFVGTAKFSNREMTRYLDDGSTTYGLGWFIGRDGQMHCGVDQEELISYYKHGVDASKGNNPWSSQWDVL